MKPLYDDIGKEYDTTRRADPEIVQRLRNHLQVSNGTSILDIACGTGNYTVELSNSGLEMTGVDVSAEMISQACLKMSHITWNLADVNNLPYENGSFYGATCILAIHHFENLLTPFKEVYRVIDKGRFVIFTSSPEQINNYWLKEYFPEAIYNSSQQMPKVLQVMDTLKQAGFSIVGLETFLVQPNLIDFFLYSGKYEPQMYLSPKVRAGISTFASLALEEEIQLGCNKLKSDIESGKIYDVLAKYTSDLGDYLFVVAEKK